MVLSLHKQPFVTAHFQFITAHLVRHCALKNALSGRDARYCSGCPRRLMHYLHTCIHRPSWKSHLL